MDLEYLTIEECEDGMTYKIDGRNFDYGVYTIKTKSFLGIRHKFGNQFIDSEEHYDCGAPHGTVFPFEKLDYPKQDLSKLYDEKGTTLYTYFNDKVLFEHLKEVQKNEDRRL